jgi:hypothetical protein
MPQTIVTDRVVEQHRKETREWLKRRQRELGVVKDAPSVAPEQPYAFENEAPYEPRISEDHPFIPDRGFDGPA